MFLRNLMPGWLMSQKNTLTRPQINLSTVTYDNKNPLHRETISVQIKALQEMYADLKSFDCKFYGLALTADFALFAFTNMGISGAFLALCGYGIYYLYDNKHEKRKVKVANFQGQLEKMLSIWQAMVRDHGAMITHVPAALDLVRALSPYVRLEDLLLWDNPKQEDLSKEFMEIMASPPLRCAPSLLQPSNADSAVPVKNRNNLYGLFSKIKADVVQTIYGVPTKESGVREKIQGQVQTFLQRVRFV